MTVYVEDAHLVSDCGQLLDGFPLCLVTLDKFLPSLPNVILINKCQEALPPLCPQTVARESLSQVAVKIHVIFSAYLFEDVFLRFSKVGPASVSTA